MRDFVQRILLVVLVVVLCSGVVAASTSVGGTVVVEENERVGDRTIVGGDIVIEGTVDGDLRAYGGDVRVTETGEVTGIVRAYGGDVRIDGTVGGSALGYGGSVTLGESGTVDRNYGGVGASVTIGGTVGDDAVLVGGTVTLEESAVVEGSLFHQGELVDEGGSVEGSITPIRDLSLVPPLGLFVLVFRAWLFLSTLLLGALLLYARPGIADAASDTVREEPVEVVKTGLLAILAVAVAILALSVTLVGIPIAVAVFLVALVLAWIAGICGRYVVGDWLLSRTEYGNRYLSLLVGVTLVALVGFVPYLGSLVGFLVLVIGAGILGRGVLVIYDSLSGTRRGPGF